MPKFHFQLEGVLKQREGLERERQRLLAVALGKMQKLEEQLRELDRSVQAAHADARQHHLVGKLDMSFLAAHRRFIASSQRQAMSLAQKMAAIKAEIDQARALLAEAAKQRKVIEKLRERQYDRWKADLIKKETAEMDEIGMQLAVRHILAEPAELREDLA
jgi:flagellar FliJ protein